MLTGRKWLSSKRKLADWIVYGRPHQAVETEALRRTVLQNVSARRAQRLRAAAPMSFSFGSAPRNPSARPNGGRGNVSRDRTPPTPAPVSAPASAPASDPDAQVPTWEQERAAVFEAICALRHLCETLHEQLAELRHKQTRELGMLGA